MSWLPLCGTTYCSPIAGNNSPRNSTVLIKVDQFDLGGDEVGATSRRAYRETLAWEGGALQHTQGERPYVENGEGHDDPPPPPPPDPRLQQRRGAEGQIPAHQLSVLAKIKSSAITWMGQPSSQPELTDIALEYTYADLASACNDFALAERLGEGAAGAVYRGVLRGGTEVAVKVLADRGGLEGFEDEVRVLSRFRHPNLVTLLGWGKHETKKYLVYELLHGGDVQGKLQKSLQGKDQFVWQHRLRAALGAATGLAHMMGGQPKVFHRDIKPGNILLDEDGAAKMADFGLAGVLQHESLEYMSVEAISGTPGYACPAYVLSGHVTEQSEVYSYGIVLLELMTNRPPCLCGPQGDMMFPLLQAVQPAAPGSHERLLAALDQSAGTWPLLVVEELADLALACVDMRPERRPNFTGVVRELHRLCNYSQDLARRGGG